MAGISQEEAFRRVKLSIDRQLSGDIDPSFGDPGKLSVTVMLDQDREPAVIVKAQTGKWAVFEDGSTSRANLVRTN